MASAASQQMKDHPRVGREQFSKKGTIPKGPTAFIWTRNL